MKLKSTFIFAIVVAAIVAYAYFISFKGKQNEESAKTESTKLFTWKSTDVDFIRLIGAHQFEFKRGDDGAWSITSPIQDLADAQMMNSLLDTILDLKSEELVAEGSDLKLDLFGLGKGARLATLKNKQQDERTLTVGTETGVAGKRFVRINQENKIHLVEPAIWTQLDHSLSDYRGKTLFQNVASDVEKFHLINRSEKNKGDVTLERKGEKWQIQGQPEVMVDSSAVDRFFQGLHDTKASDVIDPDKEKTIWIFGLKHAMHEIEITLKGGKQVTIDISQSLLVKPDGKPSEGKTIYNYARVSDRTPYFAVGANLVETVEKNATSFRDKAFPFQFDADKVDAIEVETPQVNLSIRKEGADKWVPTTGTANGGADREVDVATVRSLFSQMKMQRVVNYLGTSRPSGLESTKGHYTFKDKDGHLIFQLVWGSQDKKNQAPARTNNGNEYFTVDAALINTLPAKGLVKEKKTTPTTTLIPNLESEPAGSTAPHASVQPPAETGAGGSAASGESKPSETAP